MGSLCGSLWVVSVGGGGENELIKICANDVIDCGGEY